MKVRVRRWKNRLLAKVFTAFPSLASQWGRGLISNRGTIPWSEPRTALRDAVMALVATGGVHRVDQRSFDMGDEDGDPTYREIPTESLRSALIITHDYYDHSDADRDLNLVFPVERLRELQREGALGSLHPLAYSFMGHIDGPHLHTLVRGTGREVARRLADAGVTYALLIPA